MEKSSGTCASPSALRIQDTGDLRKVFAKYDSDGDGKISSLELRSMLESLGDLGSAEEEVDSTMRAADLDGDGFISLEEYLSVNTMEKDPGACMEDLRSAFGLIDQDSNGVISPDEVHHVLEAVGENASLADCKGMIDVVDKKRDGVVDFDEFTQMMTRSSSAPPSL